jgi:hypothetical protein
VEQDPVPPPPLRIGDRERDTAIALLQQAAAEGRLSLAELDSRLEVAMRATTYADLRPVIVDLIDRPLAWELDGAGLPARRPGPPGYSADDPLRLDGAQQRVGGWTVPPFLRINPGSRWVRLDFQHATPAASVIDVEVIGGAGWVLLVLPSGWAVDVDRLGNGWGSTSIKVPHEPAAGQPLLVLRGSVGAGRLRVRLPNQRDRRIARRSRRS